MSYSTELRRELVGQINRKEHIAGNLIADKTKDGENEAPSKRRYALLNTAMVRKIDDLGRIVVPAETRRLFNIREGDELAISVDGDSIIIRKLDATCVFCGSTQDVGEFKGRGVCASCRSTLAG